MKAVSDIAFANNIGTYQRLICENAETFLIESSNRHIGTKVCLV